MLVWCILVVTIVAQVTETDFLERENEWGVLQKQVINKTGERN